MRRRPRGTGWEGVVLAALLVSFTAFFAYLIFPRLSVPDPNGFLRALMLLVIVLGTVWLALRLLGLVFERITWARARTQAHARSLWKVVTYVVWGAVLVGLVFGYMGDVTSTALSLGILGAGLAFALQKPLLNLVGWMLITTRQVYRIGDRVEIGGVRGYVTDMGLMHTELQEFGEWMQGDAFTGRIATVPNSLVIDGAVRNYTRDFPFVWDQVEALVTSESDIDAAKNLMMNAAVEVVGGIMFDNYDRYKARLPIRDLEASLPRAPELRVSLADSGVRLYVLYFCPAENRGQIRARIAEKVWRSFTTDRRVELASPRVKMVGREDSRPGGPAGEVWTPAARASR